MQGVYKPVCDEAAEKARECVSMCADLIRDESDSLNSMAAHCPDNLRCTS